MKNRRLALIAAALTTAFAVAPAFAGNTGKFDPYTQGARAGAFNVFAEGARAGKFDTFSEGARAGKFDINADGARQPGKYDTFSEGARYVSSSDGAPL